MKKSVKSIFATLAAALLLFGCDFFLGPNEPAGSGNLVIGFGDGGSGRAVVPTPAEQALLRYELVLTGPGSQKIEASVPAGGSYTAQVDLGEWHIYAEAYNPANVRIGTGSADVTVKAGKNVARVRMAVITYTVAFDTNGGSTVAPITDVVSGTQISAPGTPNKPSYAFVDWFKEPGLTNPWNFTADTVTADITLYAKWTTVTYTVTFNADSGTPAPSPQIVADGGKATAPEPMTKTGYTFGGWYKEAGLTNLWNFAVDTVTAATALYAKWIPVYTVTFDTDGGSAVLPITGVVSGAQISAPGDPTKANNTFGGWYKEAGLTNPWDFSTDTVTASITLYAKWIPVYTVTFNANDGTPAPAAQTVAQGGTVTVPAAMTKTGYAFGGWYKEATFATLWDFSTDTVTENIILYAKWTDSTPPADVTSPVGTSGPDNGEITLTWIDPTDLDLDHIEITWPPDGTTPVSVAKTTQTRTIPGLTGGSYTFTLKAVDTTGNKSSGVSISSLTPFVSVTDITGVATTGIVGTPLTLSGTVVPSNATNQTIVWSVNTDGGTEATISTNSLSTTGAGTVVVTATIADGTAVGTNYTQDFNITVSFPTYTMKSVPAGTVSANIGNSGGPFYAAGTTPVSVSAFSIGETEITYELWHAVRIWAVSNGYTFANAGREGDDGVDGAAPTAAKLEPVTYVSWRDAVVWCNAYSEVTGKTPVYMYGLAVLRTSEANIVPDGSGKAENATLNPAANGFRLPTEAEWEYAARGGVPATTTPWTYTYAGAGSGVLNEVAVHIDNSGGHTAEVKSKTGSSSPYSGANSLGLYDMSGNITEWCQEVLIRGGSWGRYTYFCEVARRESVSRPPYDKQADFGFRVVCVP